MKLSAFLGFSLLLAYPAIPNQRVTWPSVGAGSLGTKANLPVRAVQSTVSFQVVPKVVQRGLTVTVLLTLDPSPSVTQLAILVLLQPPPHLELLSTMTMDFQPPGVHARPLQVTANIVGQVMLTCAVAVDAGAAPGLRDLMLTVGALGPRGQYLCREAINVVSELSGASIFPEAGATAVPIHPSIEVQFSAPLVAQSVTNLTFSVRLGDSPTGPMVPGTIAVAINRIVFFPRQALEHLRTYTIVARGGINGIRGSLAGHQVVLLNDFLSRFTTESVAQSGSPPGDGTSPVRTDQGGTVTDDRGTGASITIPPYTLKSDTLVRIIVLDAADRFREVSNGCDVALSAADAMQLPEVPGATRASEVVRFEGAPCGTAFGPGMSTTLPLRATIRDRLRAGTELSVYQLGRANNRLRFLDTGIRAQVTQPINDNFGSLAISPNLQTFGTYAAFIKGGPPQSTEFRAAEAGAKLFFPVIRQTAGSITRLWIANSHPADSLVVDFTGFSTSGSPITPTPARRTIAPSGRQDFLVSSLFPTLQTGTIVAEAMSGMMTGFYEIADNSTQPNMLDGAEGIRSGGPSLLLPLAGITPGGSTEVYLSNPNDSPVTIKIFAFNLSHTPVKLRNGAGLSTNSMTLTPHAQFVSPSSSPSPGDLVIPYDQLAGGYLLIQSAENLPLLGAELLFEQAGSEKNLAVLNGLAFPAGCLSNGDSGCDVDPSPASPVPSVSKQHTLYATYFDSDAQTDLYLVNVSESDALVAVSAFRSDGSFRSSYPPAGFFTLHPHELYKTSVEEVLGFNPGTGYLRVEDPNSALVGALVTWDPANRTFMTSTRLVPDDPAQTQTVIDSVFSRVQNDPDSADPNTRVTTGLVLLNPNNNAVTFTLDATDGSGMTTSSPERIQGLRSTYTRDRQSLAVDFPGFTTGYLTVRVTDPATPGAGKRILPLAIYRASKFRSAVLEQPK